MHLSVDTANLCVYIGSRFNRSQSIQGSCWRHWRCGVWYHEWWCTFLRVPNIWRGCSTLQKCKFL